MSTGQISLQTLATSLGEALRQEALSNRMLVAPRRLDQIGGEVATAFLKFLEAEDEAEVRTYGGRLAVEGLGHRAILTMTETLRQAYRESADPATLAVAGRYVNALLEGYMAGREEDLLREQERNLRAFERARSRQEFGGESSG
jgi:hypothetical protein